MLRIYILSWNLVTKSLYNHTIHIAVLSTSNIACGSKLKYYTHVTRRYIYTSGLFYS